MLGDPAPSHQVITPVPGTVEILVIDQKFQELHV